MNAAESIVMVVALIMSVIALGLSTANLVGAIKDGRTARWGLLRGQVYLRRAEASLEETMSSNEITLLRLKDEEEA